MSYRSLGYKTTGVIPRSPNVSRKVLAFLEWLNQRYICCMCVQSPEHEADCEFYALLQELRARMM
jgi:hypothetical protein